MNKLVTDATGLLTILAENQGPFAAFCAPDDASPVNLSTVVYGDAGTALPTGEQTGNIERPFATMPQVATALATGGTAILSPGDYSATPVVFPAGYVTISNLSGPAAVVGLGGTTGQQCILPTIDATALFGLALFGTISFLTAPISAQRVDLNACAIECVVTTEQVNCEASFLTVGTLFTSSTVATYRFRNSRFYPDVPSTIVRVPGGSDVSFVNVLFDVGSVPTIEFTGAPGNLVHFDESSMASFVAAGGILVNCDATSANMPPLTNLYYLDGATPLPDGDHSGHVEKPLKTLDQLAAVSGAASILVAPGDYSGAAVDFASATSIAIQNAGSLWHNRIGGASGTNVILPRISCVAGDLLVQGCACSSGVDQTNIVTIKQCNVASTVACSYVFAEDSLFVNATLTIATQGDFTDCEFHTAAPGNTVIAAANTCKLTLRGCTFRAGDNPAIVFASGSNNVDFDEASLISFLAAGGTITNGQYLPIAGPLSGTAAFGPVSLATGQTIVASLVLPDVFAPDVLAVAGVVTSTKPGAFIVSATYVAITHTLEIYADNYTGAPIVLTDAVTLRWKLFAP